MGNIYACASRPSPSVGIGLGALTLRALRHWSVGKYAVRGSRIFYRDNTVQFARFGSRRDGPATRCCVLLAVQRSRAYYRHALCGCRKSSILIRDQICVYVTVWMYVPRGTYNVMTPVSPGAHHPGARARSTKFALCSKISSRFRAMKSPTHRGSDSLTRVGGADASLYVHTYVCTLYLYARKK